MSGFSGNPDAEAEHAIILSENGIEASRQALIGRVLTHCNDCGDAIPGARIEAAIKHKIKCELCITCQELADKAPTRTIRMLDWIL